FLHVRQRKNLDDLSMERGDDVFRRSARDEDSDPTVPLDIGIAGFSHRWHVGQRPRARLARYRKCPQLAALDLRHDWRKHIEAKRCLASDAGGDRRTSASERYVHEVEAT